MKHLIYIIIFVLLIAQCMAAPLETGLKGPDNRPIVWEETDTPGTVFLSLENLNEEGLTETEIVAIVCLTPAGRYEVLGGRQEAERSFRIEAYLGYIKEIKDAPILVLGWLVGKDSIGATFSSGSSFKENTVASLND